MSRRENAALIRAHFWINREDHARLKERYGSTVGMSKAVRTVIKTFLDAQDARAAKAAAPVAIDPDDLLEDRETMEGRRE